MTGHYEWKPMPHELEIRCSICSGQARFEFAEVVRIKKKTDLPFFAECPSFECQEFIDQNGHKWTGAVFFPGLRHSSARSLPPLPEGYSQEDFSHPKHFVNRGNWPYGTLLCERCVTSRKHKLDWPSDAWNQIEYKDEILWAFNRGMFLEIKEFLEDPKRSEKSPENQWRFYFRYIPTHFKVAKARKTVTERIAKFLSLQGQ